MTATKRRAPGLSLAIVFVGFGVLVVVGFVARTWRPFLASEHGTGIDKVITYLLLTTGVIFLVGHLVLGWFVWRFRDEGDAGAAFQPPSRKVEWAWAAVPLVLFVGVSEFGVVILGAPVWTEIYGEPPPNAIEVDVVGQQFEWLVRYPGKDGKFGRTKPELVDGTDNPVGLDEDDPLAQDDIVLRGEMHVPLGRPMVIRLRTHDVLHSFAVPAFRVKQDLVPGFTTRAQFRATKTGRYEIACAELCGLGHYKMRGFIDVEPRAVFDAWLGRQTGWFK